MTPEYFSKYSSRGQSSYLGRKLTLFQFWTVCSIATFVLLSGTSGQRTNPKIYEPITGSVPCFRRFNGTHQSGCSSSSKRDVGVVYLVDDPESLDWVTKDGPHSPYIAVVHPKDFNKEYMVKFQASERVAGVLVLNSTNIPRISKFSNDLSCPNAGFGFYNDTRSKLYCQKWNDDGSGMIFDNWDFPVFYVHDQENSDSIIECYEKFNKAVNKTARDWPLCAAQLSSFMLGAIDTPTCLRRSDYFQVTGVPVRVCDAMGDLNLWSSLIPTNQSEPYPEDPNGSVIIVAARFDGSSMFDELAPAADTAVTGIVTLLTVLKQLSALKDELRNSKEIKNVYFMLFHGEAFDYIGSSRMVYDMKNGDFPSGIGANDSNVPAILSLKNIKYFIEIGQVASSNSGEKYYIHQTNPTATANLTTTLVQEGGSLKLVLTPVDTSTTTEMGLPPSSIQSFLRERRDIPGIIVSNHEKAFRNKFYNSIFDDAVQLQYNYNASSIVTSKIASLSATLSNSILRLMNSTSPRKVEPDSKVVDELLNCFVKTANCTLFQTIAGHDRLPSGPFDLYVGVHKAYKSLTLLTKYLMIYFQGDNVTNITEQVKCEKLRDDASKKTVEYHWINGTCFESSVNSSEARSPAFLIENYDWSSRKYSTWTESVWTKFSVRVFLKPSRLHEILTLVFGIATFLVSFIVVGWVSSKSDIIFQNRPEGLAC